VAGHHSRAGLGGNCLRSWLLRGCAGAAAPAVPGLLRVVCFTRVPQLRSIS